MSFDDLIQNWKIHWDFCHYIQNRYGNDIPESCYASRDHLYAYIRDQLHQDPDKLLREFLA